MSIRSIFETVVGSIEQKRRWRESKARMAKLPASHRKAYDAVQRYLMYAGGVADGEMPWRWSRTCSTSSSRAPPTAPQ